jgi:hypothetical protein
VTKRIAFGPYSTRAQAQDDADEFDPTGCRPRVEPLRDARTVRHAFVVTVLNRKSCNL